MKGQSCFDNAYLFHSHVSIKLKKHQLSKMTYGSNRKEKPVPQTLETISILTAGMIFLIGWDSIYIYIYVSDLA